MGARRGRFPRSCDGLASGFGTLRIELIAAGGRGFLLGIPDIQFRMSALRLQYIRTFSQLARLAPESRLVLAVTRGRLILSIAIVIGHAESLSQVVFHDAYM